MQGQQRTVRMMREIEMLRTPPPGVSAWTEGDGLFHLGAVIEGLAGSPYEGGRFRLNIQIPPRFPFEPPHIQFMTPIYHPNIDAAGRICLDMLKMPPKGSWKPSVHLSGVLNSIRLLMQEPNPDDPLADDVAAEFKTDYEVFCRKAREATRMHAMGSASAGHAAVASAAAESLVGSASHTAPSASESRADAEAADQAKPTLKETAAMPADAPVAAPASAEPEVVITAPAEAPAFRSIASAKPDAASTAKPPAKPPVKRSFASIKASKRAVDSDDDDDDDDAGGAGASRRRISRQ